MAHLIEAGSDSVRVAHAEAIATWTLDIDPPALQRQQHDHARHGAVSRRGADRGRVNHTHPIHTSLSTQTPIKDRFREWVWEDPERAARLARDYNDRFNNLRLRQFDGAHLTLPGMVREQLRDHDLAAHQKRRGVAHPAKRQHAAGPCVEAGKTWTMAAAAMEMRRMGLARKPMFVVPNHLVEQWGGEFLKLYPQARLFIAGRAAGTLLRCPSFSALMA